VEDVVPAFDPEEAYRRAIEAGLIVHSAQPLNAETPIPQLGGGVVTPSARFYVRNHFHIPMLDASAWRLEVGGLVERPLSLSLRDLRTMRSQTLVATLECAGNGRTGFDPPIAGEQWRLGAVSTAEWTGVPLVDVLDRAGIRADARELVFRGADSGTVPGRTDVVLYERSLNLDVATGSEALLVQLMNGESLPIQHGYPLRLVVPDWYGMSSVKWLTEIELIAGGFSGHFQVDAYVYEREQDSRVVREPVTLQRVRSLITAPTANQEVALSELTIRGVAWSGAAPIARVEVGIGDDPWQEAQLVGEQHRHGWRWWELTASIDRPGPTVVRARATDLAGFTQPDEPEWNRLGYGNNAVQKVSVYAE
jgi:DMSO/TMAO reductase YedYZ molybdopterin-dependent catalytic subunit